MLDLNAVDLGFSRKAEVYDEYCENHPVIRWARDVIRHEAVQRLPGNASILELNAGTGSDAAYFVQHGYRVHATDIASGMIAAIQKKIALLQRADQFTVQKLSFTELDLVEGGPYDLVFSNFGGLNCIPALDGVVNTIPRLLKSGGHVLCVIMPPICPWELAQVLRGKFRLATRRLHREGVLANVEGAQVMTWYYHPEQVIKAFGHNFRLVKQQSISLFCPPSYMDNFPHRFPSFTRFLLQMDEHFGRRVPFHRWGDFVAYTFQYGP